MSMTCTGLRCSASLMLKLRMFTFSERIPLVGFFHQTKLLQQGSEFLNTHGQFVLAPF